MRFRIIILSIFFLCFSFYHAKAQISFGGGFSTLKIAAKGYNRPFQPGATFKLGMDIGERAQLVITPSYFFPSNYVHKPDNSDSPLPDEVEQTRRLRVVETSALFTYNVLGSNHARYALYAGAGPGVSTYNIRVEGEGKNEGPDVYSSTIDLVADLRLGGEWEVAKPLRIYAELAIAPIIATNIEEGVDDLRTRGTMIFPSVGLRIPLGPPVE